MPHSLVSRASPPLTLVVSTAYLSPGNLSNAFPFFSDVTNVNTFDIAALNYFNDPNQFQRTKFDNQLGCTNAQNTTIRYERTVLCSMWVNEQWSVECFNLYNNASTATSPKMVCQETCYEYSASEKAIASDTNICPTDNTNGNRQLQLLKDFGSCTDWQTLATNNSATCVAGPTNEGNCGYGTSTDQLCSFCSGDTPDDCCYSSNADISICGFALPARPSSASSSASSLPATSAASANNLSSGGLHGGKLAGVIVGSVLGDLLLLGLILGFLLCRRHRRNKEKRRSGTSSFAAGTQPAGQSGMFNSVFTTGSNRNSAGPNNMSEKGLLGGVYGNAAHGSSPTMGGDTLYSGHAGAGKGSNEGGALGAAGVAGAGFLAAGGAGAVGNRSSGIVLPRVRDENQNGEKWIETGADVTVLWPYQSALPDELNLVPGMKLRVLRLYDDSWGTAQVIHGGEPQDMGRQGAFPIVCVSEDMGSVGSSGTPSASSPPSSTGPH